MAHEITYMYTFSVWYSAASITKKNDFFKLLGPVRVGTFD